MSKEIRDPYARKLLDKIVSLSLDLAAARVELGDAEFSLLAMRDERQAARREAEEMRAALSSLNYTICDYLSYDPPIPLTIKDQLSEARRRAGAALAKPASAPADRNKGLTWDDEPDTAQDRSGK